MSITIEIESVCEYRERKRVCIKSVYKERERERERESVCVCGERVCVQIDRDKVYVCV